jgi:hypothetical protein
MERHHLLATAMRLKGRHQTRDTGADHHDVGALLPVAAPAASRLRAHSPPPG